jgi:hypothetical protein
MLRGTSRGPANAAPITTPNTSNVARRRTAVTALSSPSQVSHPGRPRPVASPRSIGRRQSRPSAMKDTATATVPPTMT